MNRSSFVYCALALGMQAAVVHAEPPQGVSPSLFDRGNLRIAIACAEQPMVTPDLGLRVSLDGQLLEANSTNLKRFEGTDDDGNVVLGSAPSSVGFLAVPGHHHLRIEAPDCASDERDIDLAGAYPERITGRLAIATPSLLGTTGTPNGFAAAIGAYLTGSGGTVTGTTGELNFGGAYTLTRDTIQGIWVGIGVERRHFALWHDMRVGWGSVSGTETWQGTPPFGGSPGPFAFSATRFDYSDVIRLGVRAPLGSVALAAGSGVGFSLDTFMSQQSSGSGITPPMPSGFDFSWYLPLWAAITYKPSCNWGVQAIAAYDVDPTDSSSDRTELLAGLEIEPSDACTQGAYMAVKP